VVNGVEGKFLSMLFHGYKSKVFYAYIFGVEGKVSLCIDKIYCVEVCIYIYKNPFPRDKTHVHQINFLLGSFELGAGIDFKYLAQQQHKDLVENASQFVSLVFTKICK